MGGICSRNGKVINTYKISIPLKREEMDTSMNTMTRVSGQGDAEIRVA
jgi:hypothetical protein